MILGFFESIGKNLSIFVKEIGRFTIFYFKSLFLVVSGPVNFKQTFIHMERIGVSSLPVVLITAGFSGMVLAVQTFYGMSFMNISRYVGPIVGLSMTRELGPVLTGLIVAGRISSSMAAELGTMQVTEQIDAFWTLAVNPYRYLVVPRLIASIIMLPLLTAIAAVTGIMGGLVVSASKFNVNPILYYETTRNILVLRDIYNGLIKAFFFGMIIAIVGCYKGFSTRGGAEGVGLSTTGAVVLASILILVSDYYLTIIFF
ncbi:MAG: ABC transporter permease [bacterium]|nr:ABC transporter permease [bacterium]